MPKRTYILSGHPYVQQVTGRHVHEVKERTDGAPWQVVLVVANDDAVAVLEALHRAYTDGREDHAEDADVQAQERWKALKDWLAGRIRSLESDAGDWKEHAYMAEVFRAKADAYRSVLVQMGETEAGQ
jgi:hypothetical protein